MQVAVERRAEIAVGSLSPPDRHRVMRALAELEVSSLSSLLRSAKVRKVRSRSGETLYVHRGAGALRLILSYSEGEWTVEDVLHRDRVKRLLPPPERK